MNKNIFANQYAPMVLLGLYVAVLDNLLYLPFKQLTTLITIPSLTEDLNLVLATSRAATLLATIIAFIIAIIIFQRWQTTNRNKLIAATLVLIGAFLFNAGVVALSVYF